MFKKLKNDRALLTIFFVVFIDLMGFGLILPLLPFIAEKFNADAFQIGLLTAVYSFFQFVASPVLGRLSDRFGRKKLLMISQFGSMIGFLLLGFAHSLPLLFISRIIDGTTGGNISIAQAYIADITDKKNRAKGMGVIGAAFGIGFILGPVIGGVLSNFGFWVPAFFAAAVSGLTILTTGLFLQETVDVHQVQKKHRERFTFEKLKAIFTTKPLGLLIVVFFLINFAFSGMQGTFALWAQATFGWGPTQIGYVFAYIGVLSVIIQLKVLPLVIKRFGDSVTLLMGIPLLALGLMLIPLSVHLSILLFANALLILGNSLTNPTIQALASENVEAEDYGETLGILQSSASFGRIIGPILAGELFNIISKDAPFISSGIILILTYFILEKYLPKEKTLWNVLGDMFRK